MLSGASLVQVFKGRARNRPIRLLLTLLQIGLAAFVVTVALHALEAERARSAQQMFFGVHALVVQGEFRQGSQAFTPAFVRDLLGMAPDVEKIAIQAPIYQNPRVETDGQVFMFSNALRVDVNFLDVLGISITSGAPFVEGQNRIRFDGILLEDEVANAMFLGADPLGRMVRLLDVYHGPSDNPVWPPVHRVVGTYRYSDAIEALPGLPGALFGLPVPFRGSSSVVVLPKPGRARAAQEQVVAAASQLYASVDPETTFEVLEPERRAYRVFNAIDPQILVFSLLGIAALVLVGVGVFSMTVVDVSEQTHQIGVRRVLGASRWRIASEYAATAGLYALIASGLGAVSALGVVPSLQESLGGGLLPGAVMEMRPVLAVGTVLVMLFLSAGLGLVPALASSLERPAVALRER